jgi:hypothetical protein
MGSNQSEFLKISLKSLALERIWREKHTIKNKIAVQRGGLYWREFSIDQERIFMKYSYEEIAKLPDKLSLEDFRVVCHISKRTARYYLQSGLVICENNGKKTHCYIIQKRDLIAALKEFEEHPCKFYIPKEFYNGGKYHKGKMHILTYLPDDDIKSPVTKAYYEKKMEDLPDLLCSAQIADITGYDQKTIRTWCVEKRIKYLSIHPRVWIPKEFFMNFLLSEEYNNIPRKSQTHLDDIHEIYRKIHRGG